MLRQLIVDRFNMKYHTENRSVGAFVLTADNPRMTKSDPSTRTRCVNTAATGRNPALTRLITCQNATMAQFAEMLPEVGGNYLTGPVADMTGLEGTWDFTTVNYSPQDVYNQGSGGGGDAGAASTPTGAFSIFEAIDRQLGLKAQTAETVAAGDGHRQHVGRRGRELIFRVRARRRPSVLGIRLRGIPGPRRRKGSRLP